MSSEDSAESRQNNEFAALEVLIIFFFELVFLEQISGYLRRRLNRFARKISMEQMETFKFQNIVNSIARKFRIS